MMHMSVSGEWLQMLQELRSLQHSFDQFTYERASWRPLALFFYLVKCFLGNHCSYVYVSRVVGFFVCHFYTVIVL